ncbi:hypothetical protein L9G15_11855 [Shewanella sp. A3A]|uniref:Uncharacterized protein n=1 Tax=Shewanella electrica TaxID=515560 RepID=A0ABT2FPQ6_9GAMM|nr:hypothetical protein [Shewanella electrica]MCH1920126.1 hypothetical protein [Shewanella ferrihydritica]MCH1926766.1 hypothetical protein [Shewanella electrica]MCS4558327.1 hypothetical protein [Shewanella electrica]
MHTVESTKTKYMVHSQAVIQERRGTATPNDKVWQALTAEQKMAFYRLQGYGYRLLFIRKVYNESLAIVAQNQQLAAIDSEGNIDLDPQIKIRA